jgi:hypothetical protein
MLYPPGSVIWRGQAARQIIGGNKAKPRLAPGETNMFIAVSFSEYRVQLVHEVHLDFGFHCYVGVEACVRSALALARGRLMLTP